MSPAALSAILLASLLCAAQASSSDGSCGGGGCLHGGSCVERSGGVFSCSCPSTHIGEFCQQENPCLSSPCSPSRTCSVRTDGNGTALFECSCPTGWSGEQCQVAVDVCSVVNASAADSGTSRRQAVSITCLNGGNCVVTAGGSQACRCPVGFSGPRCDVEDECAVLRPCQHSGTCLNTPGGYRCKCSPLYTGNNCERVFTPCQPSPCSNGGACHVTGAITYSCTCPAGFGGTHCEQRIGNCSGHRCANGARCLASTGTLGYSCHCPPGYTGTLCTEHVDECRESPCLNGATCRNISPGHACSCARGWTGDRCQTNIDDCASSPCQNGGTCHDGIGSYRCECTKGYTGQSCQLEVQCPHGLTGRQCDVDINECSSGPCQNNGTCIDQLGRFHCVCSQGYDGTLCERNVNKCLQLPCRNGATCRNRPGSYTCECTAGFEGRNCDINVDDCRSSPCRNGGTCVDKVNGYACRCRRGYFGRNCSSSGNAAAADCLAQPCHSPGTASCRQHADGYQCLCKDGWRGRWCDVEAAAGGSPSRQTGGGDVGACSSRNPCQNGGRCVAEAAVGTAVASASSAAAGSAAAARCRCPARFTGRYCDVVLAIATPPCSFHSCSSSSTCSAVGSHGYQCLCPPGSHGILCEVSSSSSRGCHSGTAAPSPCGHNALSCQDAPGGGVVCQCKANWSGVRCQTWSDPGEGEASPQLLPTNSTLPAAAGHCTAACTIKASNGQCDAECNSAPCLFDGSDCQETTRTVPWSHCSALTTSGKPCRDAFNDGTCDGPCNIAGCLYDGFDCLQPRKVCDPTIESYCKLHYANGYCDRGCYNEECGWDGLDCLQKSEAAAGGNPAAALARGELHVVVLVSPREFLNRSGEFLLTLGRLLRTVVKLKADEHSRPLVVPWTTVDARGQAVAGTLVTLTLDNSKCAATGQQECFETTASAAEFVAAALHNGWTPGLGIGTVSASSTDSSDRPNAGAAAVPTYVYLVAGAVVLVIVAVLVGAYFGGRRKRARGITWFPEGFAFSSSSADVTAKRKCPEGEADGEDLGDAKLGLTADEDEGRESPEPLAKKHCGPVKSDRNVAIELLDKRAWNARHYDACLKSSALTPPRHDEQMPDANCRGPSGITPLMLAATSAPTESCRSLRSVTSTPEGSNQSAEDLEALTELIDQGANIRERDDRGETALHHAARCGRADEARFLLDKGSDPNAKDLTGRTPLHAAVAADAYRVFQTLLRDRRTNLNERTHDGATAMILAARLEVDDMVAELIQSKADVNATDEHGKTALHWASAVNNVAAATMLLKFGVNCDVQDDQEQTPLHLAAKEGSYEVANMLVSYGASLDIADCQERLPEDLALERHHRRLVALLQQQHQHCGQQMEVSFGLVAAGAAAAAGSGARRLGSKKRCHRSGRLGMAAAAAASAAANGWWRANGLAQPPTAGTLPTAGLLLGGEEALPLFVGYMHSSQPDREASRLAGLPGVVGPGGGRAGFGSLPMASFDGSGGDGRGGALGPMQQAYDLASGPALSGAGKAGNGSPLSPYPVDYGRGGGWPSDASSQSAFGSRTLPVKQQLHLRHDVRVPSGFVLPGWRGAGTVGSFGRQPSAASADCRLPFIEGQPGGGGGSHELAGLSASDRAHAATAAGSFASADDPPACRWGGRGRVRSAAAAPTAADALDSMDGACATTPSPDSGTGWSSDCSGFSPQACGGGCSGGGSASASCAAAATRGSHYCTSCNVASSRPDRLSSLSNGSPHSDWSDCISPIEPSSCMRHDSVFA